MSNNALTGFLGWLLAWSLFLLILYMLAQQRWGHTIIYYGAWLVVFFLILSHYQEITSIFQAGGITSSGN